MCVHACPRAPYLHSDRHTQKSSSSRTSPDACYTYRSAPVLPLLHLLHAVFPLQLHTNNSQDLALIVHQATSEGPRHHAPTNYPASSPQGTLFCNSILRSAAQHTVRQKPQRRCAFVPNSPPPQPPAPSLSHNYALPTPDPQPHMRSRAADQCPGLQNYYNFDGRFGNGSELFGLKF